MKRVLVLCLFLPLIGCATISNGSERDAIAWRLGECRTFYRGNAMAAFFCEDSARRECVERGLEPNCEAWR